MFVAAGWRVVANASHCTRMASMLRGMNSANRMSASILGLAPRFKQSAPDQPVGRTSDYLDPDHFIRQFFCLNKFNL